MKNGFKLVIKEITLKYKPAGMSKYENHEQMNWVCSAKLKVAITDAPVFPKIYILGLFQKFN